MDCLKVIDESQLKPNVIAFTSQCEESDKHIIIWDFDRKSDKFLEKLERALNFIAHQYKLSRIYLIETRNGYNGICLDKLPFNSVYQIKNITPFEDKIYLENGLQNHYWRLRIGKDKTLSKIVVTTTYNIHVKSNAHREVLNKFFDCNILKDSFFDNTNLINFQAYWCWKESCHDNR